MRVLPILFQSSMVRAILREVREPRTGKWQTRRVMNPQPKFGFTPWRDESNHEWMQSGYGQAGDDFLRVRFREGDLLYVREGFHLDGDEVAYMADHPGDPAGMGWRPSIHLPRAHSRLTLKVTAVRVQRLQDITDEDALAEGVCKIERTAFTHGGPLYAVDGETGHDTPSGAFKGLWREINGDASWAANPWVVAITFSPRLMNVDAALREAA